ncbi:MAG: Fic family protein, partial [Steroidobacteraceae bacterium]
MFELPLPASPCDSGAACSPRLAPSCLHQLPLAQLHLRQEVVRYGGGGRLRGTEHAHLDRRRLRSRGVGPQCHKPDTALLWVEDPATHERIRSSPGELRTRDVAVGGHIAISAPAVPRFLGRFEEVYGRLGKTGTILAAAAAHHRLAWIHPFLDGNGRVARLMSHATLLEALDTGAVCSAPIKGPIIQRLPRSRMIPNGLQSWARIVIASVKMPIAHELLALFIPQPKGKAFQAGE